ncbi:hypothetical protein [Streptomyces sp. NPDC058086]
MPIFLVGLILAFVLPEKRIGNDKSEVAERKTPDTGSESRKPEVPSAT